MGLKTHTDSVLERRAGAQTRSSVQGLLPEDFFVLDSDKKAVGAGNCSDWQNGGYTTRELDSNQIPLDYWSLASSNVNSGAGVGVGVGVGVEASTAVGSSESSTSVNIGPDSGNTWFEWQRFDDAGWPSSEGDDNSSLSKLEISPVASMGIDSVLENEAEPGFSGFSNAADKKSMLVEYSAWPKTLSPFSSTVDSWYSPLAGLDSTSNPAFGNYGNGSTDATGPAITSMAAVRPVVGGRSNSYCAGTVSADSRDRRSSLGRVVKSSRSPSISAVATVAAAAGADHHSGPRPSSVYKYVAQAQMAMQSDTVKVEKENMFRWLGISKITSQRREQVLQKMREKSLSEDVASDVLSLFTQRFLDIKLEILALEFNDKFQFQRSPAENEALDSENADALDGFLWLNQRNKRTSLQLKQFPRFVIRNSDNEDTPYCVEVRTSSGYNDYTSTSSNQSTLTHADFMLLRLRHLTLMRESDDRKRKNKYYEFIEGKMKRPLNSFMLYRSTMMKSMAILKVCSIVTKLCTLVQTEFPEWDELYALDMILATVQKRHGLAITKTIRPTSREFDIISQNIDTQLYELDINNYKLLPVDPKFSNQTVVAQIITLMWNTETEVCKNAFVEFSQVEKEHHHWVYPKYKYCPIKKTHMGKTENSDPLDDVLHSLR